MKKSTKKWVKLCEAGRLSAEQVRELQDYILDDTFQFEDVGPMWKALNHNLSDTTNLFAVVGNNPNEATEVMEKITSTLLSNTKAMKEAHNKSIKAEIKKTEERSDLAYMRQAMDSGKEQKR
jgi:uncharacterized protein YaaW (UPF0174 family)